MKKKVLGMLTILFCVMMLPMCVQAASIDATPKSMKVNDVVEIKVKLDNKSEAIQFDVNYDNDKYDYVIGSAKTSLSYTTSNVINQGGKEVVRVVAVDYAGKKTNEITLKFKATATGTNVPFTVAGDKVIIDSSEEALPAGKSKANVNKIEPAKVTPPTKPGTVTPGPVVGGTTNNVGSPYINDAGQPITSLPQTGGINSVSGIYYNLIAGTPVVLYALPNSDTILGAEHVTAEFVGATGLTGNVKTGDTFTYNSDTCTVLIYGDVNKDGKVDVRDALIMIKEESANALNAIETLAGDLDGNSKVEKADALILIDKFIVKNDSTNTNTAVEEFPVEITEFTVTPGTSEGYRFENILIGTLGSASNVSLTENVLTYKFESIPLNATESKVEFIEKSGSTDYHKMEMKLYPTAAGTYKIVPILSGNKVKDGKIEGETITVTVTENYTVTDMALNKGNQSGTTATVKLNSEEFYDIKYYHTYTNNVKVEIPVGEIDKIEWKGAPSVTKLSNVTLYQGNNPSISNKNNDKILFEAMEHPAHTTLNNAEAGSETLTLQITNNEKYVGVQGYGENGIFEQEITVNVIAEKLGSIKLNGSDSSEINVTIYNVTDDTAALPDNVIKEDDYTYTLVSIAANYTDGTACKLYNTSIDPDDGNISITEDGEYPTNVAITTYDNEKVNLETQDNSVSMSYIGIAIDNNSLTETDLAVTIDTPNGLVTKTIHVKVEDWPAATSPFSLTPFKVTKPAAEELPEEEPVVDEEEEPIVTEPEATEPEVTEPETPVVTEPKVTEPEVTEPETPVVTEPEVTEPEVKEPEAAETEPAAPEVPETPVVPDPAPEDTTPTGPEVTEGQTPVTPEGAGVPTEPAE